MMMGLVYECGDLFFFGLYRYFAFHCIFDYDYDFLAFYDDLFCGLSMKILKELKNFVILIYFMMYGVSVFDCFFFFIKICVGS